MEWDRRFKFGTEVTDSRFEDKVIVGNFLTGDTVKMTSECYEIIKECIDNVMEVDTYVKAYDEESREYLKKLFLLLEQKHIIFDEQSTKDDELTKFSEVSILLTNRCNLRCTHCCMDSGCGDIASELTTDEWKQTIDKLVGLDIKNVSISGGEPLLRKDLFEIAEYIKSKFDVKLALMTNAILINEDNVDRLVNLFDSFSISLDGADEESCAPVRGKGTFEKSMRGINLLKSKGAKNLSLSFTIVKQNENKVEEFKKLAKELGAYPMIRLLDLAGRAAEHPELIPTNFDRYTDPALGCDVPECGYFPPEYMPRCSSCGAGYQKFSIDSTGNIYPCSAFIVPETQMGNVKEIESLKDYVESGAIRNNKGYKKFCSYHPAHSDECKDCSAKMYCMTCVYQTYVILNRKDKCELCNKKREGLKIVWK